MENTGLYNEKGEPLTIDQALGVLSFHKVDRLEVIDKNGRAYTNYGSQGSIAGSVDIQLQDEGKTMKVFVDHRD